MFSGCPQNRVFRTSGRFFCCPGPQKGAPQHARGAPRTPKPPIWKPHFTNVLYFFPLGPRIRPQALPRWVPRAHNDPKDVLQTSKIRQKLLQEPKATRKKTELPVAEELQKPSISPELPKRKKHRGAAVSRQRSQYQYIFIYYSLWKELTIKELTRSTPAQPPPCADCARQQEVAYRIVDFTS